MTTFTIDTNDKTVIEQAKKLLIDNLHLEVKIKEEKKEKNKWADFTNKIDDVFTPNIVEHIKKSRDEARENFITSI